MRLDFAKMALDQAGPAWEADSGRLYDEFGIVIPDAKAYLHPALRSNFRLAQDAQPSLVTVSNAGIPSFLANYVDPELIEVLISPMKAAKILGEGKKGDWTTLTAMFPVVEHTGQVASYGDWSQNGSTGANANFPQRQSYHYQTMTQWGERQLDMAALAKLDWSARLNKASAIVLNKFQNKSYFFGISGLQNYGLLTDPNLSAALTPGTKTKGGTGWIAAGAVNATADEVYADIQRLWLQLVTQTNGLVEADAPMKLCMSPTRQVALTTTNQYNVNVTDQIKKNFPNMEIETAPEYDTPVTGSGSLVQLIATSVDGGEVGTTAFTEKMRAHAIVRDTSSFKQKKSQGTWGAVIFRPMLIAQMIGV